MVDPYYSDESDGSRGYFSDIQYSPDPPIYMTLEGKEPSIKIIEQPGDFRYRYEKERYHGHILGVTSPPVKKKDQYKFPTVKICNYNRDVIIRCWLITTDLEEPKAHFHKLARKTPKGTLMPEPHDLYATDKNNYEVAFDYLHIVHAVINDENHMDVYEKKKRWIQSNTFDRPDFSNLPKADKEEIKQMDKNQSILYFQAFDAQTHVKICEAVSRKIMNLHNAETAPLKIVNYSKTYGSCKGRDEVFMFVEKISKDVEVRFFEEKTGSKARLWEAKADYGQQHVHHQYGIVFKTPPFRDQNLTRDSQVFVELFRKTDHARSLPVKFTYKPDAHCRINADLCKKRSHSPERAIAEVKQFLMAPPIVKKIREEPVYPDTTMNEYQYDVGINISNQSLPKDLLPSFAWEGDTDFNTIEIMKFSEQIPFGDESENYVIMQPDFDSLLADVQLQNDSVTIKKEKELLQEQTISEDVLNSLPHFQSLCAQDKSLPSKNLVAAVNKLKLFSSEEYTSSDDVLRKSKGNDVCGLESIPERIVEELKLKNIATNYASAKEFYNDQDFDGYSRFLVASESSKDILTDLLKCSFVDRNVTNLAGDNALLCASRKGREDLVHILLKNNFDPNVQNYKTGESPLHIALINENIKLVKLLLQYGANPHINSYASYSPYDYSINCSNEELVNLIFRAAQCTLLRKRTPNGINNHPKLSSDKAESNLVEKIQCLKLSCPGNGGI